MCPDPLNNHRFSVKLHVVDHSVQGAIWFMLYQIIGEEYCSFFRVTCPIFLHLLPYTLPSTAKTDHFGTAKMVRKKFNAVIRPLFDGDTGTTSTATEKVILCNISPSIFKIVIQNGNMNA